MKKYVSRSALLCEVVVSKHKIASMGGNSSLKNRLLDKPRDSINTRGIAVADPESFDEECERYNLRHYDGG